MKRDGVVIRAVFREFVGLLFTEDLGEFVVLGRNFAEVRVGCGRRRFRGDFVKVELEHLYIRLSEGPMESDGVDKRYLGCD